MSRRWSGNDLNRLGFHFSLFDLFDNRLNLNLDVLNNLFRHRFDGNVCGFFCCGDRLSFLRDFFSHHGIFFGNDLRGGINRRSNDFRMGRFNFHSLRCHRVNNLRFNHGCCFSHDVFHRCYRCNHLFGHSLFFNSLLRASNRITDPDFTGCHLR
ncbi:Uncharacterised protein [Enterobacter cloacae]|nr:Uncharacterised protein [Enterobacter cloacae]